MSHLFSFTLATDNYNAVYVTWAPEYTDTYLSLYFFVRMLYNVHVGGQFMYVYLYQYTVHVISFSLSFLSFLFFHFFLGWDTLWVNISSYIWSTWSTTRWGKVTYTPRIIYKLLTVSFAACLPQVLPLHCMWLCMFVIHVHVKLILIITVLCWLPLPLHVTCAA